MTVTLQYQVTGCIDEAVILQTRILELPGSKKCLLYLFTFKYGKNITFLFTAAKVLSDNGHCLKK